MLPILKFSLQMVDHVTLASLSSDCHDIVKYYKFVKKGSNLESESKIFGLESSLVEFAKSPGHKPFKECYATVV